MSRNSASVSICLATLACLMSGCGSGLGTVPVQGLVTYQGKPLDNGTITFQPASGPSAFGAIGSDGHYKLTTQNQDDGAIPGHYRIGVVSQQGTPMLMPGQPGYKANKPFLPMHLGQPENSRVEADVPGPNGVINIDLK